MKTINVSHQASRLQAQIVQITQCYLDKLRRILVCELKFSTDEMIFRFFGYHEEGGVVRGEDVRFNL